MHGPATTSALWASSPSDGPASSDLSLVTSSLTPSQMDILDLQPLPAVVGLHRSTRTKVPLTKLKDFLCNIVQTTHSSSSASPASAASSGKSSYPLHHYFNCDKFSTKDKHFLAIVTTVF